MGPRLDSTPGFITGGDWIEWKSHPGLFFNNQLVEFDPQIKTYSCLKTNGTPPSPRSNFAVAEFNHNVYLHGGFCDGRGLDDFHVLDMKTLCWSQLVFGLPSAICNHSLLPISSSQLLLVGGDTPGAISKAVWIYNITASSWSHDQDLPSEFCGGDGGLMSHKAVVVTKEKKAKSIVCVGGFIDAETKNHPNHILKFDLD